LIKKNFPVQRLWQKLAFLLIPVVMLSVVIFVSAHENNTEIKDSKNIRNVIGMDYNDFDYGSKYLWSSEGTSSYYANKFHLKRTASGERYNKNDYSAAHRTLPFGTIIRVYNPRMNKSTLVRINDRGPFIRKRIVDLSLKAASAIDGLGIPNVILEGFSPDSFNFSGELTNYYLAYSFLNKPMLLQPELFEIADSTKNFDEIITNYKEFIFDYPSSENSIFVLVKVSDYRENPNDVVYYLGSINYRIPKRNPYLISEKINP
jgi:rare lipoprotein A